MIYQRSHELTKDEVSHSTAAFSEEFLIKNATNRCWEAILEDLKKNTPAKVEPTRQGGAKVTVRLFVPLWRPVSENPRHKGKYLVTDGDQATLAIWFGDTWEFDGITHWMYMPESPNVLGMGDVTKL